MVKTASSMLPLGTKAPDFTLKNTVDGQDLTLSRYAEGSPVVIAFICNHCPYVVHIIDGFVELAKYYQKHSIKFIAISSNDIANHPDDAPDKMQAFAKSHQFTFPYCYDESQQTAKTYQAECTPDIYLFDAEHHCYYRGQFDGATPGNDVPVTGEKLQQAIEAVLKNELSPEEQNPSMGCNIKWKV